MTHAQRTKVIGPEKLAEICPILWQSMNRDWDDAGPAALLLNPSGSHFSRPAAFNVLERSDGGSHMNKDELDGKAKAVKGRVKQGVGDLTDNDQLHEEGVADEAGGKIKEGVGKARRKVGDAIEDVGDRIKE
jgi:uncharacterized protein YjbJ (UPF0337 family)